MLEHIGAAQLVLLALVSTVSHGYLPGSRGPFGEVPAPPPGRVPAAPPGFCPDTPELGLPTVTYLRFGSAALPGPGACTASAGLGACRTAGVGSGTCH